ncbi:2-oxoglutarate dehydrogenase E1 component [Solemya pervernicosa gill symbiont]|uniref:2-oxoglutarate dehydrogenase E1 component n=2 Tax=Gammaproteobacteria incertae sedis TaxID=118884 RepID=A0A1T2L7W6_9GAMM|nr:2-oxoglutarate dehydrogenase E1 component [Solemya pervernicosa gill symbiont]QKQ28208.1 2-oxoglutarate dehydrogenase E1 component [Candidatus Reidiella endopervernicosa]
MQERWQSSMFDGGNAAYIEQLYDNFIKDPDQLDERWRAFFEQRISESDGPDRSHHGVREQFRHFNRQTNAVCELSKEEAEQSRKQVHVLQLINAYRFRGHQLAAIDPLGQREIPDIPELRLDHHGLSDTDCETLYNTGSLVGPERATLSEILDITRSTYCGSIGTEYMHILSTAEKRWIQNYLEGQRGRPILEEEKRRRLLRRLIAAEGMERYLHRRYVGQKRFSLEGGDSLIPLLHEVIQCGGEQGMKEMAISMAHRGRLNVLINVMGKTPAQLFEEFEGTQQENSTGTGDVKYHMGFFSDINTAGGQVHVVLGFNPSHLEISAPVVEGSVRARQERRDDKNGKQVVPILIHGDAAFSGQGVVMETFNMSQSRGYSTKGTIHIVINNQIGFTTSSQEDARSTLYCTDVAKMVGAPIFHVNGDDPEAVIFITQLAVEYRMRFHKDVVIDLVCYRRHGHSEADEPMATQPLMYQRIRQMPTTRDIYARRLIEEALIDGDWVDREIEKYREALAAGHSVVDTVLDNGEAKYPFHHDWSHYGLLEDAEPETTAVPLERIQRLNERMQQLPDDFEIHPGVGKILHNRQKMAQGELAVDWGFAETMAYATLVDEGTPVRLSGQDCGRGTFFHRHAVLHDQRENRLYVPLRNISDEQANFLVINSLLSEEAVLAFEYGYATTEPQTLTIWEAQFGDFANNAQVVIDQFISAGEQKWNRLCGLVLLLPHGLEGQGPEHSSARLERFLQLCAQRNMQVVVPSSAAQIFHLLRRQMLMKARKPLIVMSPKSLLRHPEASSPIEKLTSGSFKMVLPDGDNPSPAKVRQVILCSGKVYYDLRAARQERKRNDVAIIRFEQLYPFPEAEASAELARYKKAKRFVWCQEEPKNQGAWYASQHHVRNVIGHDNYLEYVGRRSLAAPAVGYAWLHKKQLEDLVNEALGQSMK